MKIVGSLDKLFKSFKKVHSKKHKKFWKSDKLESFRIQRFEKFISSVVINFINLTQTGPSKVTVKLNPRLQQMRKSSAQDIQLRDYPPDAFKRGKKNERNYNSQQIELKQINKNPSRVEFKESQSHRMVSDHSIKQDALDDEESSESENDQIQKEAEDLVKQLQAKQAALKANNKMVVGGGFSFDITEFFKFQKKKKLDSNDGDIFTQISGSVLAWIILLYSVCNSAMIPSWIMNIKATKLLRISWRFFMQTFMIFPFVLYEKRSGSEQVKSQYTFKHIINPEHLKKVYISSISTSLWFTVILTVFEWTYVSHGIILGSLSNFFLSIHRSFTKSEHDLEPGGRYCVVLGILLLMYDSYNLPPDVVREVDRQTINPFYIDRQWWQRNLADLVALWVSFTQSKISRYTADMKSHYPPYLSMLLANFFVCINMILTTYFFNGLTFDYDPRFGWFSIFSQEHFAGFMYMSIVLCFGMFVSFVLISKLFSDPIIPALAMTLDPVIATVLLEWSGIQNMPHAISFIGYFFVVPGLMLILVGQCLFQRSRSKSKEEQQIQKRIQMIKEVKQIKLMKSVEDKKNKLKRVKSIKNEMTNQNFSHRVIPQSHKDKKDTIKENTLTESLLSNEDKGKETNISHVQTIDETKSAKNI